MARSWDELIERLLNVGIDGGSMTDSVEEAEVVALCNSARQRFLDQPPFIEMMAPVKICGDIHGQYADLLRLFARAGFPPSANFLFLGDYVDRGRQSLETICLLFAYKLKYPCNFFLLRGNHELRSINRNYGFYDECERRYSTGLYETFQQVFACMPFAASVSGKLLCMHGGLSPMLTNFNQLRNITRPHMQPRKPSLEDDLLWSDPDESVEDGGFRQSPRGTSFHFGEKAVVTACERFGIDLVVRAHQVVEDGYEFFAGRRLVTLFSAPHYCGEYDNAAAVMSVDARLHCSFEILRPSNRRR